MVNCGKGFDLIGEDQRWAPQLKSVAVAVAVGSGAPKSIAVAVAVGRCGGCGGHRN